MAEEYTTYRTGHTLGTTIYQNDDEQPCIWVPNSRTLAAQIVTLLNGEAEASAQVAALTAERDAAQAELAAAKRDTEGLRKTMRDVRACIGQSEIQCKYPEDNGDCGETDACLYHGLLEQIDAAMLAACAPEGTEGIGHDETAA